MRLTKSQYMAGRSCVTKVVHMRDGLPTVRDEDTLQEELSSVGAIVHWMAPHMYHSVAGTNVAVDSIGVGQYGTYVEVDMMNEHLHSRADVLRYRRNDEGKDVVSIVEYKSKVYKVDAERWEDVPMMQERTKEPPYMQDLIDELTFQWLTLIGAAAEGRVPFWHDDIVMEAKVALLNPFFESSANDIRPQFMVDAETGSVRFLGDIDELIERQLLILLDVTELVGEALERVFNEANSMLHALRHGATPALHARCASCEFRVAGINDERSGFMRCWGERALQTPFILDLTEVGRVKPTDNVNTVEYLASQDKYRMTDIDPSRLTTRHNNRQARQIEATRTGEAMVDPALAEQLAAHAYPRVFIDVEAISAGIPYWPGCRPYEVTTFQWSAHTLRHAGALDEALQHSEWLHNSVDHPCMAFLRSIRDVTLHVMQDTGTIYMWSQYERTAVKAAHAAAVRMNLMDAATSAWVEWFLDTNNPQIVDMLVLARRYYMHPDMHGSASVKHVLPAVWRNHPDLRLQFPEYVQYDGDVLCSPYHTLPSMQGIGALGDVRDGTAAILAYAAYLYNWNLTTEERHTVREALLAYCKLDTAAMVIIHEAWRGLPDT